MHGMARLVFTIYLLLGASCHQSDVVLIDVTHFGSPYGEQETKAHTLNFVRAFGQTTGDYPSIRTRVYWRDRTYAPNPVGGYGTDNGLHVAIDETIEDSALWHELAHLALCSSAYECDSDHQYAEVWAMVEERWTYGKE